MRFLILLASAAVVSAGPQYRAKRGFINWVKDTAHKTGDWFKNNAESFGDWFKEAMAAAGPGGEMALELMRDPAYSDTSKEYVIDYLKLDCPNPKYDDYNTGYLAFAMGKTCGAVLRTTNKGNYEYFANAVQATATPMGEDSGMGWKINRRRGSLTVFQNRVGFGGAEDGKVTIPKMCYPTLECDGGRHVFEDDCDDGEGPTVTYQCRQA